MHAPVPVPRSRLTLPLLVIISMLGPVALNILMPSMPGLVKTFSTTRENVQLTLSLFLLAQAVSQLFLGPLSDRYGRRPVLIVAISLYTLASLAAIYAHSIEMLILARIGQAFGATAGITLARTIIRDLYQREQSASMIGYVTMTMVVAPMLSPAIGGFLDERYGWQAIFAFCAATGLIGIVLIVFGLRETRPAILRGATYADVGRRSLALLRQRRFLGYVGTSAAASAAFFSFLGGASYLVIEMMHLDKRDYGLWFMTLSLGYMIGNYAAGRLARRMGIDQLIFIGNLIGIAGAALLLAIAETTGVTHPAQLFLPSMVIFTASGLIMPNSVAGTVSVDPAAAGAASGLGGFAQMTTGAAASFLAGQFTVDSARPLCLMIFGWTVLSFLIARWGSRAPKAV